MATTTTCLAWRTQCGSRFATSTTTRRTFQILAGRHPWLAWEQETVAFRGSVARFQELRQQTPKTRYPSSVISILPSRALSSAVIESDEESSSSNVVPFLLADIGEGIQEVEVLQWFVHVGDTVQEFDTLCQVQSDKATVEITSRFAGKIVDISSESKIRVGQPLVHIATSTTGGTHSSSLSKKTSSKPISKPTSSSTLTPPETVAAPALPSSSPKIVPFLLADIGEGIQEVEVLQWYVHVGDTVQEFDTICQVQSDKATVDITSRFAGKIVDISKEPNVKVGQPLVHIETLAAAAATAAHMAPTALERQQQDDVAKDVIGLKIPSVASHYALDADDADANDPNDMKYQASPAVRKLAADHQINVRAIQGTGPQGRILKADILHHVKQQKTSPQQSPSAAAPTPPVSPATTTLSSSVPVTDAKESPQTTIVSMTGYNRFMVQSMTDSLKIPHMGLGDEINVDKLLAFRKEWNDSQSNNDKDKLGMQTLLIKACSLALHEFPQVNAKTHDAEKCQVCYHANHDIGIAMDTPHGLVVPVLRNVQTKSLLEVQHEVHRLKQAAASGTTALADLAPGPTFVLSNIGAVGVGTHMSPVLVPPMIAMGALGRIQRLPRFDEHDQVVAVNILYASWAADHRFLDGATLARFHKSFAKYASNPILMLPHLK